MTMIIAFSVSFIGSYFGTEAFRRWSAGLGVLDVPNERSSHDTPTPRGGGLIIAAVCLASYVVLCLADGLRFSWGYFAGALLVSGISWLDDLRSISFTWRLAVHVVAAILLILNLGPLSGTTDSSPLWAYVGYVTTVLWVVWLINAYNFMDGIDGIAGLQAVVAGAAWATLSALSNSSPVSIYAGVVACASLGFLVHNWQPAKIFMGDVGSAFLGFTLASLPLLSAKEGQHSSAAISIAGITFVFYFVFDTVVTFTRRLLRGERVWQAHRTHLYQRMVISGMRHASVTLIYGIFAAITSGLFILSTQPSATSIPWTALTYCSIGIFSIALVMMSLRKATV
ncbi:MAG TPA: glycosyltransferase family 4 protein, partial [Pyrinomonadaceae bacterium]|nr:glycosyltransferase family 4 protein [Pyrinomonadaceae bacterium]